jgi:hypothetical protein
VFLVDERLDALDGERMRCSWDGLDVQIALVSCPVMDI